jgi:hypothetical protein
MRPGVADLQPDCFGMAIKFKDVETPAGPKGAKPKAKEPAQNLFPPENASDPEPEAATDKKRGRPGKAKFRK